MGGGGGGADDKKAHKMLLKKGEGCVRPGEKASCRPQGIVLSLFDMRQWHFFCKSISERNLSSAGYA